MRGSIAHCFAPTLALCFAACGPLSVRPNANADDGGGADGATMPDSATSACAAPRMLLEGDTQQYESIAYERVPGGYIEVTASRAGTVSARLYDARWNARSLPTTLTAPAPTGPSTTARRLAVSFLAERGAITFGSTLWDVRVDSNLSLSTERVLRATEGATEFYLVGAWHRRTPTNSIALDAVTSDASEWSASPAGLVRLHSAPMMVAELDLDASVQFVFDSTTYLAFETVWHRDINNESRVRSLIAARGGLFQLSARSEVGTRISPVVRVGDELWRLHYKRNVMVGADDNELSLVVHEQREGATLSSTRLRESGLATSGAIAASERGATLLAWAREVGPSAQPAAIVVQRAMGSPVELYRSSLSMAVLGAWIDEANDQRWVSFATYTRESTPRRTVYVQCVE